MPADRLPDHNRARTRTPWRLGAVALAVGPSLLLPCAAQATPQRHAGRQGGCQAEIGVASSTITAGESATLAGSLVCAVSAGAAEQTVTIYQHDVGTPGFSVAGSATTEASGAYRFTTGELETNGVFYVRCQGARSERVSVKVAPLVTISPSPEDTQLSIAGRRGDAGASASNTVTFAGTVGPDAAGARVVLQRESSTVEENWLRIGVGEVGPDGAYSITHTFSIPGSANIRVVVRARGLLAGVSEPLSYQIAQRQNPRLTIQASPGPLSYGQSVTLSGTAAGGAHVPLTLLARTRDSAFAPVATVMTDAAGSYTFPAQSPLRSMLYRVTGARSSSATLFEAVKPVLTAQVASTNVQAGEPLMFSGTVTPDHTGQVVYLERQNADGVGFHIVAAGTLDPGGTYSIEHTASGAATQVFRIKIAGDGEEQAVASEPFEIQVTRAANDSLEAQAPGAGSAPAGES
jgi:hypothetical protein